jgi:dihydroxy-acid dehydratase
VQTGDRIRLDVPQRSIELLIDDAELQRRAALFVAPPAHEGSDRGYSWLFQQHVTQADEGCDFDFLMPGRM